MKITPLSPEQAGEMARLHQSSFDPAWSTDDMRAHIERDLTLGCLTPELAGFSILSVTADQADILTIIIDQAQRGKGLGRALLAASEAAAHARGVQIIFLEVAEDNPAAIGLYRGAGFQQIGRRPGYYRRAAGRVAALTFRKTLDGARAKS